MNSSNYDPIPLWLAGCQMVALNYQAQDKPVAYNRALFRANGQCGYILKPQQLLQGIRTREGYLIYGAKIQIWVLVRKLKSEKKCGFPNTVLSERFRQF